ncbi:MAG: DUF108 domain-containing protein [Cryobacterium sp.]|nr:DUF108 domain-containing protein [Cryobacterium sp.]
MTFLRVAVVGAGAIGSSVAEGLASGAVPAAILSGVIVRRPESAAEHPTLTLEQALVTSDLIVECASVAAVATIGPRVIDAGKDLLVTSVGALADAALRRRLLDDGPGRTFVTTGAIGGLDLLAAASRGDGLHTVRLTTTKAPSTVVQPWMSAEERDRILTTEVPIEAYSGTVQDAIRLFPKSLNVAVSLALATRLWDSAVVTMIADPAAELTTHRIVASGRSGDYDFTIRNLPHPANPATSAIVPQAVLAGIARLAKPCGSFA